MTEIPTLYLNENIPIRLVDLLRRVGISAIHTLEVNDPGVSDWFQLQYAAERNYIMVTHNRRDFRFLHRQWVEQNKLHSGILVMGHNEPEILAGRIECFFKQRYSDVTIPFCEVPPLWTNI